MKKKFLMLRGDFIIIFNYQLTKLNVEIGHVLHLEVLIKEFESKPPLTNRMPFLTFLSKSNVAPPPPIFHPNP